LWQKRRGKLSARISSDIYIGIGDRERLSIRVVNEYPNRTVVIAFVVLGVIILIKLRNNISDQVSIVHSDVKKLHSHIYEGKHYVTIVFQPFMFSYNPRFGCNDRLCIELRYYLITSQFERFTIASGLRRKVILHSPPIYLIDD
jgi:hypothetical protein